VVEALSLTAALALDPTARVEPARAVPPPRPAPVPPPCPPPPSEPAAPNAFELGLNARFGLANVVAPAWSFGGIAFATLRPLALLPDGPSFGLGVGYWSDALFVSVDDASADRDAATSLTAMLLRLCPLRFALSSALRIEPCAVGKAGFLEAEGVGLSNPETVVRSYYSVGAEVAAEVEIGRGWTLALAPSLDVPLVERRFTTGEPPEPAGETPAVSAGVSLGIGYYFQ
jgi:hypothetical protein